MKKYSIIFLIGFITTSFCLSCKKGQDAGESPDSAVVTFALGRAEITHNGKTRPAGISEKVFESDIIKTHADSCLSIQIANSVVRIQQNTVIKMAELLKDKSIRLDLEKGTVLSKVKKLMKNSSFKISTPTSIAAVRGTVFKVAYGNRKSSVSLKEGSVGIYVKNPEEDITELSRRIDNEQRSGEATLLEGKTAEISDEAVKKGKGKPGIEIKVTAKQDEIEMEKVENIPVIPEIEKMDNAALQKKLKEESKNIIEKDKKLDKKIEKMIEGAQRIQKKKKVTLDDLRNKYGNLSKIVTKDGKEYIGAFKQKGGKMEIITTKGKKSVPVSRIKKVSPYM